MRRATTGVDVEAIGMIADDGDVGAEFLEYGRSDPVCSAIGTVDNQFQAVEILLAERAFAEFDVAPRGIIDALRTTKLIRRHALERRIDQPLDFQLNLVVERSEEHTSELQSLMRISYAVFCLKKKNNKTTITI